jgi:hypothetical protein
MSEMDDEETPRAQLEIETLYYNRENGQYFWTPDGIGCYWYATLSEALDDTGGFGGRVHIIDKLADY